MRRRDFIGLAGGAVAWPLAAHGQQTSKVHRLAVVHATLPVSQMMTETGAPHYLRSFFPELRELGYVEGGNLVVDRYSPEGVFERFADVARDVVRSTPDVIFVLGMVAVLKDATQSIPIVAFVSDPQSTGLAASLSHPGGNLTGIDTDPGLEVWEKRFEILHEIAPTISTVAVPMGRAGWEGTWGHAIRQAARKAGILLSLTELDTFQEADLRRAFATMRNQGVGGIAIPDHAGTFTHRQLIVQLVEDLKLPAVYPIRELISLGGLVAYSANLPILFRHAARQVAQILRGAKPGEIPFYRATKFDLVINLKTARALGLTVPPTVLVRADEIIE